MGGTLRLCALWLWVFSFLLKSRVLTKTEAMRNNSFLQARTVVTSLVLLIERLISCQVIHGEEIGFLTSPLPCILDGPHWGWLFLQTDAEVSFLVALNGIYEF